MEQPEERKIITGQDAPKLKNEFRKEVRDPYAGIPVDELVTRDQVVLMKELRLRKFVREINNTSLEIVIKEAKELRTELLALPKSPYREVSIANTGKTIENNQDVLKANRWPIESEVTLLALEELFAETVEDETNKSPTEISDEDSLTGNTPAKQTHAVLSYDDTLDNDELTIPAESPGEGVDEEDKPNEVI